MNGNSLGVLFRITTWGESHGPGLGVVIDGCPSGLALSSEDFASDLVRRQGGGASYATPRKEADLVLIESGVFEGKTTGTPIALRIENKNVSSGDYDAYRDVPRPGHADLTTFLKHGHRDYRGGGRASARETTARVLAGTVAKKILQQFKIEVVARVGRIGVREISEGEEVESWLTSVRASGDSLGGRIDCVVRHLPVGLGEPIFDKLNATLAHALMSLPAAVGFEAGGGIRMSELPGSEIRDPIGIEKGVPKPSGNRHGGLLGGIATGHDLNLRVHFHAPTSIPQPIESVNLVTNDNAVVNVNGRHDSVPLFRAVPMVEAMVAITLADALARAGRLPERFC